MEQNQTKPCTLCGQPITGVLYGREARHAVCPVSAWIPVGESLPPPGVDVLIVVSYEGVTHASISSIDGPWDSSVTHWMPLPPLPLRAPKDELPAFKSRLHEFVPRLEILAKSGGPMWKLGVDLLAHIDQTKGEQ